MLMNVLIKDGSVLNVDFLKNAVKAAVRELDDIAGETDLYFMIDDYEYELYELIDYLGVPEDYAYEIVKPFLKKADKMRKEYSF